ncbi:MAG: hypothetical protein MRJ96_02500 [Nitrospirales bacterium]|nr:hypothetical protein [Nitrospira sp.]MDR4500311.1 hypothetical protein [Nitrospirales bacterium]
MRMSIAAKNNTFPTQHLTIFWLTISCLLLTLSSALSKEAVESPPPPVFQPHETQHGFSEFDSLPEIPSSIPNSSTDHPSSLDDSSKNDLDQPPEGLFFHLDFAKSYEADEGIRRGHFVVPVSPNTVFPPDDKPIFLVFRVHQHYGVYQVFGRLYPEQVDTLDPLTLLDEDTMHLATEDDSGYLQFDPPNKQWLPGSYRVEIFVGFEATMLNKMGTMRFSVHAPTPPAHRKP